MTLCQPFSCCPHCATPLKVVRPAGDHCRRRVCGNCGFVHYRNPNVLVSCLATWGPRLLWIRRGLEPRKGFWAHPAGFMEEGERPEEAAARELYEETGGRVDPDGLELFAVGSLPDISEVYIVLRGELLDENVHATPEALEVGLFDETSAPWSGQAYPDVQDVVRCFYQDHAARSYGVYCCTYSGGINRYRDVTRQYRHPLQASGPPGG